MRRGTVRPVPRLHRLSTPLHVDGQQDVSRGRSQYVDHRCRRILSAHTAAHSEFVVPPAAHGRWDAAGFTCDTADSARRRRRPHLVQRIIANVCDLQRYLSPADLAGREQVEYRLESFKSRIAMELLQVAVRKQGCLFGFDHELVAANVAVETRSLQVDVRQLNALNDQIRDRVWTDALFQIRLLQRFHTCKQRMDIVATRVHVGARTGDATADDLIEYIDLVTSYHELGVLKFSFPDRLARREIAATLCGDQRILRDVLRPQGVSLFYELYVQRLRLAWCRLTQADDDYLRAVAQFRERYGFLGAEDMDFRERDTLDELDAEIAR